MMTAFVVHDRDNFSRNQPPKEKRRKDPHRGEGCAEIGNDLDGLAEVASNPPADDLEVGLDAPDLPLNHAEPQEPDNPSPDDFPVPCRDANSVQAYTDQGNRLPLPKETKRRANYIIRALDIHRLFHGIIYRDIVFQGRYSLPITVMLRDYISSLLFAQPLPDVGHYFNVSRFYPIDVKQDAKEDVIKYLSLGGHSGNKSKKKGAAKKDIAASFADNIGNYAREFQGVVPNSGMEF